LADVATYYRHDLACADNPTLPTNGHSFMPATSNAAWRKIAIWAQQQIAAFFLSGGTMVITPPPELKDYFEVPIKGALPEDFSYIRVTAECSRP
jgi:hypothetical protein